MSSTDRQRIVRVPGARRAQLTPAPGTSAEPTPSDESPEEEAASSAASAGDTPGPNDERLRRDVPPHY
ncbi:MULTISPECIES: hypothetical protein [Microbacterium]|uniref:Uncharacterized protein n=1 Tax=Microbacterium wangchenii TaxID=2541726 RepID=A0ABX5SXB5_9MICO|nr:MULTISPECIES: hypothetical protein [Microbacterium]MCK6067628.1 hypothetical protein [Microbacterium sp. EYE_512]QBR89450.1 hypothetical protein E4K62_12640 [Microbacterium wangchenii]TXK11123.1 hypothetical protein FVP99_17710 [Microbacterium wangchenii]